MIKQCKICNSNFEPDKWHPNQLYCSRSCNEKAYRGRTGKDVKAKLFRTKRLELINKLGGKCEACGTEDDYVLTFDHIYNDRNRKRNDYTFIKSSLENIEKTKESIQLLCWNHNSLKQYYPNIFDERFIHLKSRPIK